MSRTLSDSAPDVLQEYYRILLAGADAYGDGSRLRPLLSEQLDFTGSLAGHRVGATGGFLQGVGGFIATVRDIDVVHDVHGPDGSAVLYDAELPGGSVRFAEFFRLREDRIEMLNLHFDGPDYLSKAGR